MSLPIIFVWCNNCSPGWHGVQAMAEDGTGLAGHICSHHGFIPHDMGFDPDGWKRDLYAAHYPNGYHLLFVEDPRNHPGLMAAYALNQKMAEKAKEQG